ncbi:MAG TPA: PQQ-dependent sugar dehydrogenase [Pseudonocardia sp.]|jgi:glucose/arabinose dehydrogenase|uniref:PQQ-dependent sugar dehydrogenase n=1 Tax=Pseudonocardia sp. TaxID=60912 RepID=UPI002B4B6599|nr:PQQ-dependent sugar dehydrogenase [Pseudonocardia sp.]HLU58349.1 PQQ-dependent sugar dehydrogenase [Pseudonocardia sp.]
MRGLWRSMVVGVVAAVGLTGCGAPEPTAAVPSAPPTTTAPVTTPAARTGVPELQVELVAGGLEHVWDIGFLPDGRALVTERRGRIVLLSGIGPGATARPVEADLSDVYVRGEGGLMGMVVHPDFAESRRFTTCQTHMQDGSPTDVRLVTWQLSEDGTSATRVADPLVGGLPINQSGRHSGCRPTIAPDGALLVGTGDTARGAVSQDLNSLGGKVLRVDLETGEPAPGNPFADAQNPAQRLIWTYGHRNVQGVAVRPGSGDVYTTEHGPTEDDEVNLLRPGANYGWDPSRGGTVGGYDEDVPMTDLERFPDAVPAVWSSGDPVEAISGADFLSGAHWGDLDGALAVGALRGEKLLIMTLGPDGAVADVSIPAPLDGTFGRLRAVRLGPDGALYVSTSNGTNDEVLRVTPI